MGRITSFVQKKDRKNNKNRDISRYLIDTKIAIENRDGYYTGGSSLKKQINNESIRIMSPYCASLDITAFNVLLFIQNHHRKGTS